MKLTKDGCVIYKPNTTYQDDLLLLRIWRPLVSGLAWKLQTSPPPVIARTVHKVLMRRVLSDIYRITQEKFQYNGVKHFDEGLGPVIAAATD